MTVAGQFAGIRGHARLDCRIGELDYRRSARSGHQAGSPEQHLPPQITQLTGFGERAVWSPDGTRIAFMSKSFGDAFEVDLSKRPTRLLTGHFRHAGFLRVHYLPNGDYLLIGARNFNDIRTTRDRATRSSGS